MNLKINKLKNIIFFKETAVAFTANNELLRIPATLEEELDYVVKKVKNKDLEIKMEAKKTCYKR